MSECLDQFSRALFLCVRRRVFGLLSRPCNYCILSEYYLSTTRTQFYENFLASFSKAFDRDVKHLLNTQKKLRRGSLAAFNDVMQMLA